MAASVDEAGRWPVPWRRAKAVAREAQSSGLPCSITNLARMARGEGEVHSSKDTNGDGDFTARALRQEVDGQEDLPRACRCKRRACLSCPHIS